jgi:hypothetical protein
MQNRLLQSLAKHETLKQNESLERQLEERRIERLQQVLARKMSQRAVVLPSSPAA